MYYMWQTGFPKHHISMNLLKHESTFPSFSSSSSHNILAILLFTNLSFKGRWAWGTRHVEERKEAGTSNFHYLLETLVNRSSGGDVGNRLLDYLALSMAHATASHSHGLLRIGKSNHICSNGVWAKLFSVIVGFPKHFLFFEMAHAVRAFWCNRPFLLHFHLLLCCTSFWVKKKINLDFEKESIK